MADKNTENPSMKTNNSDNEKLAEAFDILKFWIVIIIIIVLIFFGIYKNIDDKLSQLTLNSSCQAAFGGVIGGALFVINSLLDHKKLTAQNNPVTIVELHYLLGKIILSVCSAFVVSALFITSKNQYKLISIGIACGYSTQILDILATRLEQLIRKGNLPR